MVPENLKFGGGGASTLIHPVVLVAMIVAIIMMLAIPRKYLSIVFLASAILIPIGQVLVLGGLHLFVLRIIIPFGVLRVISSKFSGQKDESPGGFNTMDKLFVLWAVLHVVTFTLQYMVAAAFINQCSFLLEALGGYLILRYSIENEEDAGRAVKTLVVCAVIASMAMLDEKFHNQNPFGLLGNFLLIPEVRDGVIRAQGPFLHPLLAGSFGATMLPLSLWLWSRWKSKFLAVVGIIAATIIVVTSASSTSVLAYGATLVAICFWPLRKQMQHLRWGIVILLVVLNLVMKAPVWFLIAHIDLTGASSGYHRAMLIDQFLRHTGDWWLIGTSNNQNWGYDMWDTQNQFVAEGESGGLACLVLFIALISVSFRWVGNARKAVEGDRNKEWCYWLLGTTVFVQIIAFFGVNYFDHIQEVWYAILAIMCAVRAPSLIATPVPEKKPKLSVMWPPVAAPPQHSPFGTVRSRQLN